MMHFDPIAGLLSDLETLTDVAKAGVVSRREVRLEPGETRFAAILFLDVVGFSQHSRILTSEQLTTLIDRSFRIFELTTKSHGGYCDKVVGDAGLYVFPGHPNYPPACEAALSSAMLLLERANQITQSLRQQHGSLSLEIRIGVAFGEVTRMRVGGEEHQLTVIGETVNIAQRLEASAEPGTVQTTIRVIEQVDERLLTDERGKFELKGFGEVGIFRVKDLKPARVKLRSSFGRLTPLIGRDEILAQAQRQVENWQSVSYAAQDSADIPANAAKGRNRLLIIRGPLAVGKSRLAYELVERLKGNGRVNTFTGHCVELNSLVSIATELVLVAGLTSKNLLRRWEKLCAHAAKVMGEDYAERQRAHLPLLALLVGCTEVDTSGVRQADARSFMRAVMLALRSCCELVARFTGHPVVLVVEDLQWLGDLRELVADLLTNAQLPHPLVVVGTARPEFTLEPGEFGEGELRILELEPLEPEEGKALIQAILPGLELPPEFERSLHEKAIGLPYYYEEIAQLLLRSGLVAKEDGAYRATGELSEVAMPEDIRMLILGRLDQLDHSLRDFTKRASVLGRSFMKSVLQKMEEKLGTNGQARLEQSLGELVEEQILGEETGGRYFFLHVLTQEAAYGSLLRVNRALLHSVAADVLQDMLVPGSRAEAGIRPELTMHLEEAGRLEEAHERCCQLLGLRANTGRFENWDYWAGGASRIWDKMCEEDPTLPEDSYLLLSVTGLRYATQGDLSKAEEYYNRALELVRALGKRENEGSLQNNLGTVFRVQGKVDQAWQCFDEALEISREVGHERLEAVALRNLGTVCRERGDQADAEQYYKQALALAQDRGDRHNEALVLDGLGMLYMDRVLIDQSESCFSEALEKSQEIRNLWGEGLTLGNLGLLQMKVLKLKEARQSLDRSLQIAQEVGDPRLEGEVLGKRANLLLRQKLPELARRDLERAIELLTQVGQPFQIAFMQCQWVFCHLATGDAASAQQALKKAQSMAGQLKIGRRSALFREIEKVRTALAAFEGRELPVAQGLRKSGG
ncbi:tetratricopeptide repeat protein [bacterium]|nr:tetratricopeptide repeat protein [bacterium]